MENSSEILKELSGISPLLASMERTNVFSVPEGYFISLFDDIDRKINTQPFHYPSELKNNKNNLSVPDGYFEHLSISILNKIRSQDAAYELRTLSPALYSIQNERVFSEPVGYFKNLSSEILDKVRPQAKIIPLKKKDPVWRYGVAAVMTGIIGLSSLMIFNKTEQSEGSQFDQSVIRDAKQYKNDEQINAGISKLSDNDILNYLETSSNETDNDALNTNIEEKDLPAQKDYFQNDKTLDNYLNKDEDSSKN